MRRSGSIDSCTRRNNNYRLRGFLRSTREQAMLRQTSFSFHVPPSLLKMSRVLDCSAPVFRQFRVKFHSQHGADELQNKIADAKRGPSKVDQCCRSILPSLDHGNQRIDVKAINRERTIHLRPVCAEHSEMFNRRVHNARPRNRFGPIVAIDRNASRLPTIFRDRHNH